MKILHVKSYYVCDIWHSNKAPYIYSSGRRMKDIINDSQKNCNPESKS